VIHFPSKKQEGIQRAVLAHIRAIRSLGRTEINTVEIADALSLPVHEVNEVIEKLKDQGVRRR